MEKVLIYGIKDQGQQLCYYIENEHAAEVAAFVVDRPYLPERRELMGHPIVAFDEIAALYPPDEYEIAVSFAYQRMVHDRAEKMQKCRDAGYSLFTFISKYATVFTDRIGEGTIIYPGCHIAYNVTIGAGNFLETNVVIAHNATMGDYNFCAATSLVCGDACVGSFNFLGVQSALLEEGHMGSEVFLGACAVVRNCEDHAVYAPVKTVKLPMTSLELLAKGH